MANEKTCPECGAALPDDAPEGICPACLLKLGLPGSIAPTLERTSPAGIRFRPPSPEELAPSFPQLEILELLGAGGMGAVYKARQPSLGRLVAVKILPSQVATDPAFAERFAREARALASLNHPNIVTVYDSGEQDGLYYFVMEYVDGVNLREAIAAGQMTPEAALAVVRQICDALTYAHEEGVVHRDIKPENILIDSRSRVKIADFGLAKLLHRSPMELTLTATYQVMGTLSYMAPEQLDRPLEVDHRADIYSLGVVFYELLTGELPRGRFRLPSERVAVDARLDDVVLKTLDHEPAQRYQQASELKTDLETIVDSPPPVQSPAKTIPERRPDSRPPADSSASPLRTGLIVAAAACFMVGLLTCVVVGVAAVVFGGPWLTFLSGGGLLMLFSLAAVMLLIAAVVMGADTSQEEAGKLKTRLPEAKLERVRQQLRWPAIGLRITGWVGLLPLIALLVLLFVVIVAGVMEPRT